MTEKRQTTVERIAAILRQELERAYSVDFGYLGIMGIPAASVRIFYEVVPNAIAAEIDALTRERDEARAEAERLRLAAEAWEARYRWGKTIDGTAESVKAQIAMEDAEDQAAAAKEAKP